VENPSNPFGPPSGCERNAGKSEATGRKALHFRGQLPERERRVAAFDTAFDFLPDFISTSVIASYFRREGDPDRSSRRMFHVCPYAIEIIHKGPSFHAGNCAAELKGRYERCVGELQGEPHPI